MNDREIIRIGPQAGPQTMFLSTEADIAIYGGAAGGGKSFGLLLDPLRHFNNKQFGAVIFRRNTVQVRNEGGLWDESLKLYFQFGAKPREAFLEWRFPKGMYVGFSHLEHEQTVLNYQGAQIAMIGFDELTHFTEYQFFYMLSRNRSTCGVKPYIRATTNPDVNSWVRRFIGWWLDEKTGFPIPERAGKLRWFIRQNDDMYWADTPEELFEKFGRGPEIIPKSATFIPSTIFDNKILMEKDPAYLGNLAALPRVERLRLKDGNWNVRLAAGNYFQRGWFRVIDTIQATKVQTVRYWDRAATKPNEANKDPDWTRGVKMSKLHTGIWVVEHVASMRDTPMHVQEFVKNIASSDGVNTRICIEQDPGSAGVADADNMVKVLAGYDVRVRKPTKDKITRSLPVSAQSEVGNIYVLKGPWNDDFFNEVDNFPAPEGQGHDDQVDGLSGAFNELSSDVSILDVL